MPSSQLRVQSSSRRAINDNFVFILYREQFNIIEFVAFQLFYKDHAVENNSATSKKKRHSNGVGIRCV